MMSDLHKREQENEIDEEEKRSGKRPMNVKQTEFDMQDAREAEDQLGVLVNGPVEEGNISLL